MNAISYINGDEQITDFPATSARPLGAFVQTCNDLLAGPDGFLSPEDSFLALDLGWLTVGTADVADTVMHTWVAESVGAELYALRAAHQSTALIDYDDWNTLDAVTGNALRAHALANGDTGPARIVEFTRQAIRSWRRLAGLSVVSTVPTTVCGAARRVGSAP